MRENLTCWPHLSLLAHCQVYKSSSCALVCSIYLFLPIVSLGAKTLHAVVVATLSLPSPSNLATLKAVLFVLPYTRVHYYNKYNVPTKSCCIGFAKKHARVSSMRYQSSPSSLSNTLNTLHRFSRVGYD